MSQSEHRSMDVIREQIMATARVLEVAKRGLAGLEQELRDHPNVMGCFLDQTLGQQSIAWQWCQSGRLKRLHYKQGRNDAGMDTWTCTIGLDDVQKTYVAYRPHELFVAWESLEFECISVGPGDAYLSQHTPTSDQKPPLSNWELAREGGHSDMDILARALFHHFLLYRYKWHE
jgi:hypothetical protein